MRELGNVVVFIFLSWLCYWDCKAKAFPVFILFQFSVFVGFYQLLGFQTFGILNIVGTAVGIFFLFLGKWTKEAIGYGDGWVILLLGVYLGGIRQLEILFIAGMLAAMVGLVGICFLRWTRKKTLPFLPFLLVGYWGVILGETIS